MWKSLATVKPYLWRYRKAMALGGLCLALKDLAQAGQPLMIRAAIDALSGRAGSAFVRFAFYLLALAAVKGLFQFWMRVILIGVSRDIEYDLRNDLFATPGGSRLRITYARTRTGDIMARATNDLNAVRMMLGPGVMYCFETGLTFALAIAIMLRADWRLALCVARPGAGREPGRGALRRRHSPPLRTDTGNLLRYFQPGAGKPGGRAHGAGLRAGARRNRAVSKRSTASTSRRTWRWSESREFSSRCWRRWWALTFLAGAVVRRRAGAGRPHFDRQLRHVQHLHGHAGVAHDCAGLGGEPDPARHRVARPHQPDSGPAPVPRRQRQGAGLAGARRDPLPPRGGGI